MFSAQIEGYDEIVDMVKEQCSVMSDPDRSDDVEFSPYPRIGLEVLEPGEHLPASCSPEDTSKAALEMREFDPEFQWTPVLVPRSERIKQLKALKAKKGHCKVPRCYPDNPSLLARWVDTQRERYRTTKEGKGNKSPLMDEEVSELGDLGFQWKAIPAHVIPTPVGPAEKNQAIPAPIGPAEKSQTVPTPIWNAKCALPGCTRPGFAHPKGLCRRLCPRMSYSK